MKNILSLQEWDQRKKASDMGGGGGQKKFSKMILSEGEKMM